MSSSSFANGVSPLSLISSSRCLQLVDQRADLLARLAPVIARDLVGLLRVRLEDPVRLGGDVVLILRDIGELVHHLVELLLLVAELVAAQLRERALERRRRALVLLLARLELGLRLPRSCRRGRARRPRRCTTCPAAPAPRRGGRTGRARPRACRCGACRARRTRGRARASRDRSRRGARGSLRARVLRRADRRAASGARRSRRRCRAGLRCRSRSSQSASVDRVVLELADQLRIDRRERAGLATSVAPFGMQLLLGRRELCRGARASARAPCASDRDACGSLSNAASIDAELDDRVAQPRDELVARRDDRRPGPASRAPRFLRIFSATCCWRPSVSSWRSRGETTRRCSSRDLPRFGPPIESLSFASIQ